MRNIIIYGAGYRGIDYACQLYKRGIEIAGFCDTYKIGDVSFECCGKKLKKSIIALENVNSDQDIIVIAIANKEHYIKVYDKIARYGIPVTTLDKVFPGKDIVANNREMIAEYHIDKMDDYFRRAEDEECINAFWGGGDFQIFSEN